jgi:YfiH family protein
VGRILDDSCLERVRTDRLAYITIPALSDFPELIHGFTTRFGGVSTGDFATLNLNFNRPDPAENVMRNYQILGEKLGVPLQDMVLSHQVHDRKVLPVDRTHAGMGLTRERTYSNIDGLATDETGLMLVTFYADCVPVYFYDPVKKVIALAHSGWKGTILNIADEAIRTLKEIYGCRTENIHAAFGPHIGACCFEVDENVADMFSDTFGWAKDFIVPGYDGKRLIDLEGIITENLLISGVQKEKISGCSICTKCHKDIFFSHRGGSGKSGTGAAFLMIRGNYE